MEYKLKAEKKKDIASLVKAGKYDWSNSNIEKFPLDKKVAKEIELVHFDRYISSEDAVKEMEAKGFVPATATDLLHFGIQYPNVQRDFPIVALGVVQQVDDNRYVACLYGGSSYRRLLVGRWDEDWYGHWRFAAVRKSKNLEAGKLGSENGLGSLDGQKFELAIGGKQYEGTLKLK